MTGLDVERDVIVEIACIVTDAELSRVDDGIQLVVHQDAETLARMDDFVRNMHTKSGLLTEIAAGDARRRRGARRRCSTTSSSTSPRRESAPLCGNSIGMDRRFLARTCPSSTTTCTTAASTCRRSRSCAGAGTRRSTASGPARPSSTARSTTSSSRSRSCATTATEMFSPPRPRTPRPRTHRS